jgi:ABC-2 type transport system permease protein
MTTIVAGPTRTLRIGWERGKLEVKEFFRQRESVVFTLAFPVILLLFFSSVVNYQIPGNLKFSQYFLPGIIAAGLFSVSFQALAIQISIERDRGLLKRLEGTPMPRGSYFVGKVIMVLTMGVFETVVLLAIGKALGKVDLPTDGGRWLTLAWMMLLSVASGAVLGITFSSLPRTARAAPATITPIALVLQFISGIYFVFTDAPTWLQHIAAIFPLKWVAQGMRSVFLPDSYAVHESGGGWQHGRTALVLLAWAVAGGFVAMRTFRWRTTKDS